MPYIKQEMRSPNLDKLLQPVLDYVRGFNPSVRKGVTNYVISRIVANSFKENDGSFRYNGICDAMGTFSAAQAEFYRRVGAVLESEKTIENGDIIEYEDANIPF